MAREARDGPPTPATKQRRNRRGLGALGAAVTLATITGCVEHSVGSARNAGIYAAKAARSAEAAQSAVATVQLVAHAVSTGKAFGTYASITVDGQENSLTETIATFRSIQPPDEQSRQLGDELGQLLDTARADLADVRIEIRRGHFADAASTAAPLAHDAELLGDFADAHG